MHVAVTASTGPKTLILKHTLNVDLVHNVAEAFTKGRRDEPLHDLLNRSFGKFDYRWYAIDMSGAVWLVTFSNAANPELLHFNSLPARMVHSAFTLHMQEADLVRPRCARRKHFPHWVDKSS